MVGTRLFAFVALAVLIFLSPAAEAQSKTRKGKAEDPAKQATQLVEKLKAPGLTAAERRELRMALRGLALAAAPPLAQALPRLTGTAAVDAADVLSRLKKSAAARDALITASERVQEHRLLLAVVRGLSHYKGPRSVKALLALVSIHEHDVGEDALSSLAKLRAPAAWKPLLTRLVAGDDLEAGGGVNRSSLVHTLAALFDASPKPQKVIDVFEACARAQPKDRPSFVEVFLVGNGVAQPPLIRLVYLVVGARKPTFPREPEGYGKEGYGGPFVDQIFETGGPVSQLRPYSDALCAAAVRALGEIGKPEAFSVLLRGLTSELPGVREASINALGQVMKGRQQQDLVVREVIDRLSDKRKKIQVIAHRFLQRQTKQSLPRSFRAWSAWHRKDGQNRIRNAGEAMAIAEGFASLRDFLKSEGHQGFDDYLRAGGRKEIAEFLDAAAAKATPKPKEMDPKEREELMKRAMEEYMKRQRKGK